MAALLWKTKKETIVTKKHEHWTLATVFGLIKYLLTPMGWVPEHKHEKHDDSIFRSSAPRLPGD